MNFPGSTTWKKLYVPHIQNSWNFSSPVKLWKCTDDYIALTRRPISLFRKTPFSSLKGLSVIALGLENFQNPSVLKKSHEFDASHQISFRGPWQTPDSEPSLTPVFLSSTCFRLPGAAQHQSGFLNFTSGSVWKWRLQWRSSGSPMERPVAHGTLIDAPRYVSAWKQRKRAIYAVYYASVATHTVFENIKMAALRRCRRRNVAVPSLASLFPGPEHCFSPWENFTKVYDKITCFSFNKTKTKQNKNKNKKQKIKSIAVPNGKIH